MGQNRTLALAWGALFRNGAVARTKRVLLASSDDEWDAKTGPRSGGSWAVAPNNKTTISAVEGLSSRAAEQSSRAAEHKQHSRRVVGGGLPAVVVYKSWCPT